MKKTILTTVSVIALMGALPALAETAKPQSEIKAEASSTGNIADDAKVAIKEIKKDTAEAYETIKAMLIGKETTDKNVPIVIDPGKTANGMIGQQVHDDKQKSVAKVTDIILENDGTPTMVIVTSNAVMGTGKMVALDFTAVTNAEKNDNILMPLTKDMIDSADSFSYRNNTTGDGARVIPNNGYSVAELLDGHLVNQKEEVIADIDNISFKGGAAYQLIVGFDKTFGMGGEKAVISYSDAAIIRDGETLNFQLNTEKTAQFEAYKKSLTN